MATTKSIAKSDYNVNGTLPRNVVQNAYGDIPLSFTTAPNILDIRPLTDIEAIRQSVRNLVLTNHPDRPFHPELGCSVTSKLFDNADIFTAIEIKDEILRVVSTYEPRVKDINVEIFDDIDRNSLYVTIKFSIKQANIATEVSFYLDRIR